MTSKWLDWFYGRSLYNFKDQNPNTLNWNRMTVWSHFLAQTQRLTKYCKRKNTADANVAVKRNVLGIREMSDTRRASLGFSKTGQITSSLPRSAVMAISHTVFLTCLSKCYIIWSIQLSYNKWLPNTRQLPQQLFSLYRETLMLPLDRRQFLHITTTPRRVPITQVQQVWWGVHSVLFLRIAHQGLTKSAPPPDFFGRKIHCLCILL